MSCGCSQLGAILRKNVLEKRRNPAVTCCESFSHLILIIFLVFGYNLSKITHYGDESYSTLEVKIPDQIYPVFDALGYKSNSKLSSLNAFSDILKLLTGPLVIPTFDEFISASTYIQQYNSVAQSVYISQSELGNSYANLYTRCALHFAPNNELSWELIKYLNQTTTTFHTLQYYVHENEDEAVSYILKHLEERALVLVILNDINLGNVDYTLRFNYSTLPNTNQVVNLYSLGFDSNYQKYIISGYMTMQDAVDKWVFHYLGLPSQGVGRDSFTGGCGKPYPFLIPFPVAAYSSNQFYSSVGFLLGLAMTSKAVFPVPTKRYSILNIALFTV